MKQRLDSPLRAVPRGPKWRGLRRIHKRYLGRHDRGVRGCRGAVAYEFYQYTVDFYEYMNRIAW